MTKLLPLGKSAIQVIFHHLVKGLFALNTLLVLRKHLWDYLYFAETTSALFDHLDFDLGQSKKKRSTS